MLVSLDLEVMPFASSLTFFFTGPFIWIFPSSFLKMVQCIQQKVHSSCLSLWWDFFYRAGVRIFFLVSLRYSFVIFTFMSSCRPLPISFSPNVLILSCLGSYIPSYNCLFLPINMSMAIFSTPNSIPISWLYILIVCISVSNTFTFLQSVSCHSCKLGGKSFLTI